MINFNNITLENKKRKKPKLVENSLPFRILIVGGFRSSKTNALLHLRNHQPDVDKNFCMLRMHTN